MAEQPRILLTFLGWAEGLSGGDRHLLEMGARWSSDAVVDVVAPPQAFPTIRSFLGDASLLHPVGTAGSRAAARGPLLAAEYMRRAALVAIRLPKDYDVVCGASHFAADAAAVATAARHGAIGVGYVYHLIAERKRRDLRTRWSLIEERVGLGLLRRHARLVFSSNETSRRLLVQRGISSVHTDVGVDVSSFTPGRPWERDPEALFVGRLVASKGVVDAIEAWAKVVERCSRAHLHVAGIGPERSRAEQCARELGVADSISWHGFVSEQEKRQLMARSRVFVAPSYEEGWGIAVCEALASGLPVVAYSLPTLDELFGDAYAPVPVGRADALADALVDVLANDDHARALAGQGPVTAARYDLEAVAGRELDAILRQVS